MRAAHDLRNARHLQPSAITTNSPLPALADFSWDDLLGEMQTMDIYFEAGRMPAKHPESGPGRGRLSASNFGNISELEDAEEMGEEPGHRQQASF